MKQYQKPKVNYENFALAEHIALCDYKLNSGTQIHVVLRKIAMMVTVSS